MNWSQYVGEYFKNFTDKTIYHVESFHSERNWFRLVELNNPNNQIKVSCELLKSEFTMVINCKPPKLYRSIKNNKDANDLLDSILLHSEMNVSIFEQVKIFYAKGFSHWDIFLVFKGAQLIMKDKINA